MSVPSIPSGSSREQLAALLEISHLLTSSLDQDDLLRLILDTATRLFRADGSSLLLLDPVTQELVFQMPFGPGVDQLKTTHLQPGQGIAGWIVKEGKPVLVNDVAKDPRFYVKIDTLTGFKTHSVLAAPLLDREQVVGVLEVLNSKKRGSFEPEDLDLLTAFAAHASVALRNARAVSAIKDETACLRSAIEDRYRTLISESPLTKHAVGLARKVSAPNTTVLLLGESGVGKEILARSIHAWSPRAQRPFVAVNCVALSDHLLESELFGHEKGAFTGALQQKKGLFELAHGGTIFLDEIGDMKPDLQAKLLRVLQDHKFERVGGTRAIQVDIRVIAATNQDLRAAVQARRFRKDLFYRLNVMPITLPPLRDRKEDIPALAALFLKRCCRDIMRPPLTLAPEVLKTLQQHDWPGNVRELENIVERAVVLASGETIQPSDIVLEGAADEASSTEVYDLPFHASIEAHKRALLQHAIAKAGGRKTKAALALQLQPTYFSRLCRQLGIE